MNPIIASHLKKNLPIYTKSTNIQELQLLKSFAENTVRVTIENKCNITSYISGANLFDRHVTSQPHTIPEGHFDPLPLPDRLHCFLVYTVLPASFPALPSTSCLISCPAFYFLYYLLLPACSLICQVPQSAHATGLYSALSYIVLVREKSTTTFLQCICKRNCHRGDNLALISPHWELSV